MTSVQSVSELWYYDDEAGCTEKFLLTALMHQQVKDHWAHCIQIDLNREINLVKSCGYMSTTSSPCNLHSSISFSTSSSPSPEPSCFTLFASQKLSSLNHSSAYFVLRSARASSAISSASFFSLFCIFWWASLNLRWHCSAAANIPHTSVDGRWKSKPCTLTSILEVQFLKRLE